MTGRFLAGLATAVLALGLAAPKAHAVVIYDWTGTCEDGLRPCTGQATAVLTLAETYVPGDVARQDDFVSFSYSSSSISFAIPGDFPLTLFSAGFLPAVSGLAAPASVDVDANDSTARREFRSNRDGDWFFWTDPIFSAEHTPVFPDDFIDDDGVDGLWSLRASELSAPGPLSLLALGLAGLALAGWRRGKAATGGGRCGAAAPVGEDRP